METNCKIIEINGPIVSFEHQMNIAMMELVEIGHQKLIGEVIRLDENKAITQVYENTSELKPGDPVKGLGLPLYAELGPGLLGQIFDGVQRPLDSLFKEHGAFLPKGAKSLALPRDKKWHFVPIVEKDDFVSGGIEIGYVMEYSIKHKIIVPPNVNGSISIIAKEGDYFIEDTVAVIDNKTTKTELNLFHKWPVKVHRPVKERFLAQTPLITGTRVLDLFFPIVKGGTAAIPGGFGTGKTMTQQALAKWSDADIIVYIGCGERGNEMIEVLEEFPKLIDPKSDRSLMERTILIANTSNMPVAAREASIYMGITLAEYYRDMGYDIAIMADSTSRWAEALRELSGRLQEMPAEGGFPAYLPSKLASFYERAGYAVPFCGEAGSITVIGAVSPQGGDFSEPVTQNTKRFVKCFWGLDKSLAYARHYPAINWMTSYSGYLATVQNWWKENYNEEWLEMRNRSMDFLYKEDDLIKIVKLMGAESLPHDKQLVLEIAKLIRIAILQQNSFDKKDMYASPEKQIKMLKLILYFYDKAMELIKYRVPVNKIFEINSVKRMKRMKSEFDNSEIEKIDDIFSSIDNEFDFLYQEYKERKFATTV